MKKNILFVISVATGLMLTKLITKWSDNRKMKKLRQEANKIGLM